MVSHYWWQGAIERGEEAVMLIKTRASLAEAVSDAVKRGHPYTTPAILVLPIESADAAYFGWIMAETRAPVLPLGDRSGRQDPATTIRRIERFGVSSSRCLPWRP